MLLETPVCERFARFTEMPHIQMKVVPAEENKQVVFMEPLQSFKDNKTSSFVMPKSGDSLKNAKESVRRRRNGRRNKRSKGLKVEKLFQDAKLDSSVGSSPAPASRKNLMFHPRPDYGQLGTKCMVKANHFLAEIPDSDLSHYSVSLLCC